MAKYIKAEPEYTDEVIVNQDVTKNISGLKINKNKL